MKDMKDMKERIQEALTEVDAEFIDESAPSTDDDAEKPRKKGRTLVYVLIAAAAVLLLTAVTVTTVLYLRDRPPAGSDIPLSGEPESSEFRDSEQTEGPGRTAVLTEPTAETDPPEGIETPTESKTPAETEPTVDTEPTDVDEPTEGPTEPSEHTTIPEEYEPWLEHEYSSVLRSQALAMPTLPKTPKSMPGAPGRFGELAAEARREYNEALAQLNTGEISAHLRVFTSETARVFLTDNDGENRLYSPVNFYFTLAALARLTNGSTRAQILSLLGEEDIDKLGQGVHDLWLKIFKDDGGASKCMSSSSLWLNENLLDAYDRKTVDELAEKFYTSVFSGDMNDPTYAALFRQWLSECTEGMLDDKADGVSFSDDCAMTLAMAMLYASQWETPFEESDIEGVFHAPSGDVDRTYMYAEAADDVAFGDKFTAVEHSLNAGTALFILPNEGFTAEDLFSDEQALLLISNGRLQGSDTGCETETMNVHLTLPKFDVHSDLAVTDMLDALGLDECTDSEKADFSAITGDLPASVTDGQHSVRVIVDETGVRAAAYTFSQVGMGGPDEEITLTFDRPFIFVVYCDAPIFVGIVNDPNG